MPACLVAMGYTGLVTSKTNIWLATRNNGVHKPEHHLINLILPFLTGVVGIVVIAVVSDQPATHSAWGLVIGMPDEFCFSSKFADMINTRMGNLPVLFCLYPHHYDLLCCRGSSSQSWSCHDYCGWWQERCLLWSSVRPRGDDHSIHIYEDFHDRT